MREHSIWSIGIATTIVAVFTTNSLFQAASISVASAQTNKNVILKKPRPPTTRTKRTATTPNPKVEDFYQLVTGKWTKITDTARLSMTLEQLNIAALQCHATKSLDITKATNITSISKRVSQQLSKVLVYQKLDKGLKRIDFKSRQSLLLPGLKIGKIRNGRDGFEISNTKVKVTISFGRIKQGNKSVPVMIEGNALYLKCPTKPK